MSNGDAHDTHSLDYEESIRGEELHVDNEAIRDKESHVDDESSRDEELSQNKEFLKEKTNKQKKRNNHSIAWDYFKMEKEEEGFVDICQLCKKKI